MKFTIAPGVFDIIPEDEREPWRSSFLWEHLEGKIRSIAQQYSFDEIRTPIFERTELFQRSVGETTDIVSKEMYTFEDKGKRMMVLRPEGTASTIRAFIENGLPQKGGLHKLFYIGPMFRYERAQAGRYRQFHQFGVEAIGNGGPEQDVEVIDLAYSLCTQLGIKNLKVKINSLGTPATRALFREKLKDYLSSHMEGMSEDSKRRFEINPLRILDSKSPEDQKIVEGAPSILDFLDPASKAHFEKVQALLAKMEIPFEIDPLLVRGLDYYNLTVFEIISSELGAHNTIIGGGRYDGLIKSLGGPDLPAFGFGCGLERLLQVMLKQMVPLPERPRPSLFFIPLGESAKEACFLLQHELRQRGVAVEMELTGRKLNKAMQHANQIRAKYVAVVGEDEINSLRIPLKEMATGETISVPISSIGRLMVLDAHSKNSALLWEELSKPFDNQEESDFFTKKIEAAIQQTNTMTRTLKEAINTLGQLLQK